MNKNAKMEKVTRQEGSRLLDWKNTFSIKNCLTQQCLLLEGISLQKNPFKGNLIYLHTR